MTGGVRVSSSPFAADLDSDVDGIFDREDNCVFVANGPLSGSCSAQQDGDGDGYGNACDFDYNNDGATGLDDVSYVLENTLSTDPQLDHNCDGAAGLDDASRALESVLSVPGPSGLACAATNTKGSCP